LITFGFERLLNGYHEYQIIGLQSDLKFLGGTLFYQLISQDWILFTGSKDRNQF